MFSMMLTDKITTFIQKQLAVTKEENVGIYRQYIVYREGSTRYFVEKNRRGDISAKIAKISAIYWLREIYRRFFYDISPPSCNVI